MNDCIFCKIIKEEIPSNIIYEDELVLAFLDIHPETVGHTLLIPKKHFQDMDDIDEETYLHIFKVAKMIKKQLIEKLHCDGITLMQNNGKPQEVKHFHLHLIPVYDDTELLPVDEVYKKIV